MAVSGSDMVVHISAMAIMNVREMVLYCRAWSFMVMHGRAFGHAWSRLVVPRFTMVMPWRAMVVHCHAWPSMVVPSPCRGEP